ncbi:MAG: phosphoribosylaminoimidazolesuccinocarboxamide synthase [Porphyromonas sp.]|nr:phosphoribosylaminoimidazolesuccinocarboxamide synthase [Porphyromonas sp.]
MATALTKTDLQLSGVKSVYNGKVRDVYTLEEDLLLMVVTDRISAFDRILPEGIPYKGEILNRIAAKQLDATADIVPNWKIATPDPMVTVGHACEPYKVEMVIRGYITGSAWRAYKEGKRSVSGVPLRNDLRENEQFETPIITPTTKADTGHDEEISREEIINSGLVSREEYEQLEKYTYALFERGTELAAKRGLILVDTKYEFGKRDGEIYLIDEIHTPDSSRFFYANTYDDLFEKGLPQRQLSKEFVRKWLMDHGFQGREGDVMPEMTAEYCSSVSERYIELYEKFLGESFVKHPTDDLNARIQRNVMAWLEEYRR